MPPSHESETQEDWEITPEGLYIATRHFLVSRGYCCANRCRNCPYINWRENLSWQHAPARAVCHTRVSPRALAAARSHLSYHQQALASAPAEEQALHRAMVDHYQHLLDRWWQ